jgi:putative ABC transport system permease protein
LSLNSSQNRTLCHVTEQHGLFNQARKPLFWLGTHFVPYSPNLIAMLKYYLLLFVRNLRRQKLFSLINLLGLTVSIASTLLIYLYVQHEFSYDRFHEKAKNIYRINQTFIWGDHDPNQFASLGPGVAYAIQSDIPEAKDVVRVHPAGDYIVTNAATKTDIKSFDQTGILAADSNFFSVFTFPLLSGNSVTALKKPASVILTEETALKYFGTTDALGKLLQFSTIIPSGKIEFTCEVTGIAKNIPENSYIQFDMLMSINTNPRVANSNEQWFWTTFETFVLLDEHSTPETLQAKLDLLPRKYAGPWLERAVGQTFDDYLKSGKNWELFVQPLTSIRLHSSNVYNRLSDVGNIKIVYVLVSIMVFIVLLSCINFMNLSTAQYLRRIKESSLRKILGSNQNQLALHFFSEAFMFCCIAALIGLGVTQLILPFYNILAGTTLRLDFSTAPEIALVIVGLIVLMSLLSGSYPAIFLSRHSVVDAMKGKLRTGRQGKLLRNGLVTFQFFISMILVVSTIVVFQQMRFLAQKDIGFNRANLMVLNRVEWINDPIAFRNELKNISGIEQAAWSSSVPPDLYDGDSFRREGSDNLMPLNFCKADEAFAKTLELDIIIGRNFSEEIPGDKERIILNETAVRSFGWNVEESVLGKKIEYPGRGSYEIVGIVRDYHYWTMQTPIQPMALFHREGSMYSGQNQFIVMRVKPGDTKQLKMLIAEVNKSWSKFAGDQPFQYSFVDDSFNQAFQSEEKFSHGLTVFAALAILIASFGLLGMIIYTLEQRLKEIGIRKVVGASVSGIWVLMVREYLYLILIAMAISVPVCIWLLNNWLDDFSYHTQISPLAFAIAGGGILLIAIFVTSYHVLKAANTNPVNILKDE